MSSPSFLDCRQDQHNSLETLRQCEATAILSRRKVAGVGDHAEAPADQDQQPPDDLVGLALSGGGVRSAAFNLGFLQSLSESGFLRYVDYLCSVSGGGYIAGHSTALACSPLAETDGGPVASFHDSAAAQMGLADRQRLEPSRYRFRHMGDYLTDYVGFFWRYVMFTLPLLFWAACLLGIPATVAAIFWRLFDLPVVRQYFNLIGLGELGSALHLGDETPMAFLPSVFCFFALIVFVGVRLLRSQSVLLNKLVYVATVLWLVSLGVSIAVFVGNGETSLGASAELQKIQTHFTWPLLLLTALSFLPLLAGRKLMQSGREHAPRWKKLIFHGVIGGATVSAVFLMVHLMARENISGYATHRDSRLLAEDVYDWNAFLTLIQPGGPLSMLPGNQEQPAIATAAQQLKDADRDLRDERERIIGRTTWEQWQSLPFINLCEGTRRLWFVHFHSEHNARTYLIHWRALRQQQRTFLNAYVNPLLSAHSPTEQAAALTERLLELAVYRADAAHEGTPTSDAAVLALPSGQSLAASPVAADAFQVDERRRLEDFLAQRAEKMREGSVFADLAQRYLLHMTHASEQPSAAVRTFAITAAERAQFNRLLLECLFPKIIRERTMVSTTIVPVMDQRYRAFWLAFWFVGFVVVGLVNINKLSPFYAYYRDQLDEYFVQTAPQAVDAVANAPTPARPGDWDLLRNLRPWEQGAPYPLMLGSAFFFNKVGVVPPPTKGSAAGDAFKLHSFLFSPLYCGTAATGYQRTDQYCGGDLRLCEAMAMSGAALTPFMIDNVWFAGLMAAFNFRIGQWLPRPAACASGGKGQRCRARPHSLLRELWRSQDAAAYSANWQMALVADGGFHDFFGLEELLLRRCKLIVVSDAGCNNDQYEFGALADVIRLARERHGIDIVDLDDDQAADLCGLRRLPGENRQQLYHTCLRILYPQQPGEAVPREGLLVYAQMSLTGREQIDLQQFRKTHPNFPDEPITNQFFSHGQIESYRQLGFHIGSVVCRDVHAQPDDAGERPDRQQIADDLVRGYLQEYYCHVHCGGTASQRRVPESGGVGGGRALASQLEPSLQEATCLQEAWRSPWFQRSPAADAEPLFRYERDCARRRAALDQVRELLSRPVDPPLAASDLGVCEAAGLLLACNERCAGAVGARFLPGGRQLLLRGLPVLLRSLPIPQVGQLPSEFIDEAHRPSPGPVLVDLASGVFKSAGAATVADFVICVMRWYGLRYFNRWGFNRELAVYRSDLLAALASHDVAQVAELTGNWKLPPRVAAYATEPV